VAVLRVVVGAAVVAAVVVATVVAATVVAAAVVPAVVAGAAVVASVGSEHMKYHFLTVPSIVTHIVPRLAAG
jgi:hypothetical protein